MNYRKKIVDIVRECKRIVLKDDIEFNVKSRLCNDTYAKIEGFLDLRIISFNEFRLLSCYIFRLRSCL